MTSSTGAMRGLLRSGAGIAVAMGVMNLATYAFTIVAARRLGPAEFGDVASLMQVLIVVNVLALGLQATGARRIASAPERRAEMEPALMSAAYRSALALGALCVALTPLLVWALQLEWKAALMIGVAAVPLTVVGGQSGILQGEQRWRSLGAVYLGIGLGRLVLAVAGMWLVPGAFGAMLGVAVGAFVPALVGAVSLGHVGRGSTRRAVVDRSGLILREVAANSHALLAFFLLSGADVWVAKVVLDEHTAGLYAGGMILAKAVLFLPQFVVVIAFPSMASRERHQMYLKGLAVVAALGIAASVGAMLFSDLAVTFIGGSEYAEVEDLVGLFAVVGMLLAMIQLMVYEVVARQHRASVFLVWAGLGAVAATATYVTGVQSLVISVVVIDLVLLLALVGTALRHEPLEAAGPAEVPLDQ